MKTTIINQLDVIRFLEYQKLCEHFDALINKNKKKAGIIVPIDMVGQLSKRYKEISEVKNYTTFLANYTKLREILLFSINNRRKVLRTLQDMPNDVSKLNDNISLIQNDLKDLILKINASVPEQLNINPLAPFFFMNRNVNLINGQVSMIVLNQNGAKHLKKLFDSFLQFNTYTNFQFIIVDRNSADDSLKVITAYKKKLRLEFMPNNQPLTSSYLNNLAVDTCQSEYLLFLHPKTIFQSDILPAFHDLLHKNSTNGIIGASIGILPKISSEEAEKYDGSIKFKIDEMTGLPDILDPIIDPGFLVESGIHLTIKGFRNNERAFIPPGCTMPVLKPELANHEKITGLEVVPAVPGFAMFCKRNDFIRAGGFDLNYFNGFEYTDLCLQFTRNLNKNILLAHDIQIRLDTNDVVREWCPPDPVIENHNLGTLINRHGYYIKHKYLEDITEGRNRWTADTLEKKIIIDYIAGIGIKKLSIAIKIPPLNNESTSLWGDYHFAHSLKNAFIRKGYPARVDLLDSWYENGYMTDDVVIVLRGIKNYQTRSSQINIMWNISHPEQMDPLEYRDYDHVFVASSVFAEELREKYGIEAENLLQCTDQKLFYPDPEMNKDEEKTDILFVGNSRGVMRKSIKYSMEKNIPVTLYGTNWENLLPPGMINGNYIKNEELRKYYSNCEILLNDHWEDMAAAGYISNRIFDALACGAIVLTDRVKGIKKVFPDGLFYYSSDDELEERINWIKKNHQKAKKLALKNSALVLQKHTFDTRAERILEVALQIHQQKTSEASPVQASPVKAGHATLKARLLNLLGLKKTDNRTNGMG